MRTFGRSDYTLGYGTGKGEHESTKPRRVTIDCGGVDEQEEEITSVGGEKRRTKGGRGKHSSGGKRGMEGKNNPIMVR